MVGLPLGVPSWCLRQGVPPGDHAHGKVTVTASLQTLTASVQTLTVPKALVTHVTWASDALAEPR